MKPPVSRYLKPLRPATILATARLRSGLFGQATRDVVTMRVEQIPSILYFFADITDNDL